MQFPTDEQFDIFYEQILKNELKKKDSLRKRIIVNYAIIATVIFTGFVFEAVTWMLLGIAFIVVFVFWYTHNYGISFKFFEKEYKKVLFSKVAAFIYPGFRYDHDKYIKLKDAQQGFLISGSPNQYSGSNFIEAELGAIHMQISEVNSYSKERDTKGDQKQQVYFNGLAAVINLPLHTEDKILIMHEDILQDALAFLQQKNKHTDSDNTFLSSYNDQGSYQKYFSPSVWLLIKNFSEHSGCKLIISMQMNAMYIGIQQEGGIVQTELFKSIVEKHTADKVYRQVKFLTELSSLVEKISMQPV